MEVLKMGQGKDFPGGMKETIPAWLYRERFEEGLKIGERIAIKRWFMDGASLEGKITESWKKEEFQFFISEHSGIAFMGFYFCSDLPENRLLSVADKVKEKMDYCFFYDLPGPGLIMERIMLEEKERLSYLFNISISKKSVFNTRKENSETENKLDKVMNEFQKHCFEYSPE